jgi:hypothetical protein
MNKVQDLELGKMARNFQEIRKAVDERERCLREAFENEIKGRYGYFKDELVEL